MRVREFLGHKEKAFDGATSSGFFFNKCSTILLTTKRNTRENKEFLLCFVYVSFDNIIVSYGLIWLNKYVGK